MMLELIYNVFIFIQEHSQLDKDTSESGLTLTEQVLFVKNVFLHKHFIIKSRSGLNLKYTHLRWKPYKTTLYHIDFFRNNLQVY